MTKANAAGDKQHFPFRRRLPPAERKIDQGGERTRKKGGHHNGHCPNTGGVYLHLRSVDSFWCARYTVVGEA